MLGPLQSAGDGDLYWQRWLGELLLQTHRLPTTLGNETYTAAGAPWVPQEWLFSLAVALASNAHLFFLLSVAVSVIPLAILISIYCRSRANAGTEAIGIVLLLTGLTFLESFGARAQVLGWGALAFFMLFLERKDRWYYAAFPTAIVWANLHASVAIAPAIVLARIVATVADGGPRALRSSRDLLMFPAVCLALFCTPFGWRLPALAVTLATSPIRHYIQEWQPVGSHDLAFLLGALPLALAIIFGGRTTLWQSKNESFPAAMLFAAMLFASRNIPLFAIVAAPLAARGLGARFRDLTALGKKARELEPVAFAGIALAIAISAAALVRIQAHAPPRLPSAAMAMMDRDTTGHRVFCENFTWCSLALGYPRLQVFIDGRCDPYPLSVWREYVAAIRARKGWSEPLERHGVDFIVATRGGGFARALAGNARWKPSYEDAAFVVFQRD